MRRQEGIEGYGRATHLLLGMAAEALIQGRPMRGTEFGKLTAFVAVANHRDFTGAAARVGISPSTLGKRI